MVKFQQNLDREFPGSNGSVHQMGWLQDAIAMCQQRQEKVG